MPRISKPRKNKAEDPRDIENTLEEMYQEPDGSLPDMKHIDYRGSRAGLMIVFFVLFFLASAAAAAWLGFFLFSPSQKFSENQVVAEITPPSQIIDGVEQEYKVSVSNTGSLALANTRIILKLPEGLLITDSNPKATTERQDSWTLGALDGGDKKIVTFKAVYGKPKDTSDTLRVFVDYKPSNFNSEFEKIADTPLTVGSEAVEVSIAKKPTDGGQEFEVKYKNLTDASITNINIGVDAGSSFKMTKTTPPAKTLAGVVTLQIPELPAGKDGTFLIDGSYPVSSTPPSSVVATISRMFNGKTIDIAKSELSIEGGSGAGSPSAATKNLFVTANGSDSITVKPTDTIKLAITYKNTTGKPVTNVSFTLVGSAPSVKNKSVFDYTNLGTIGDPDVIGKQITPDKREGRVTWIAEKTDVLKQIAPNQTVVIEATIGVKKLESTPKETAASFTLSMSADGDILQVADPVAVTYGE